MGSPVEEETPPPSPSLSVKSSTITPLLRLYWLELIVGVAIVAIVAYEALSRSYYFNGNFAIHSLVTYAACFALCSFFLNRQKVEMADRVLYSLATMAAGIVLYEIVYHYGFGITSTILLRDVTYFGLDAANGYFPLVWFLIIIAIPFLGRRYMKMNKSLIAIIAFEASVISLWLSIGYPQPVYPSWFPAHSPVLNLIPYSNGVPDTNSIVLYGTLFANMAKVISVIPAFFFNKK
jgi:hypothetical protein